MTARDVATAFLVEDGYEQREAELWLTPEHVPFLLHVWRARRSAWLVADGMVETPRSERAGEMVRALLAVAGGS
jgi:hypothetical protein